MTFKDEMNSAAVKAAPMASDTDDVAKLLRALSEDLKADDRVLAEDHDEIDEEDGAPHPRKALPLGRIAAALLAAGGIGIGVALLNQEGDETAPSPAASSMTAPSVTTPSVTAPSVTAAVAPPPSPEGLIARPPGSAPAASPPVAIAPTPLAPAPRVPAMSESKPTETRVTGIPVPVVRAPEARSTETRVIDSKSAEFPPAPPPPVLGATPSAMAKPSDPRPAESKPADRTELQAMLSPKPAPKHGHPPKGAAGSSPATTPDGRYAVQVGSFKDAANAEDLIRKLAARGYHAYAVTWTDEAQNTWKVVRVGGYASDGEAHRVAGELKSRVGGTPLVVHAR